jgi:ribosomal protein S12 methylthiotransferase
MLDMGIQEIQIISQDTTRYGTDIYGQARLVDMLESIDGVIAQYVATRTSPLAPLHADREGNNSNTVHTPKYRVYYLYPDILTLTHLERLKNLQYMLPYFDIPFQHASENVLKLM